MLGCCAISAERFGCEILGKGWILSQYLIVLDFGFCVTVQIELATLWKVPYLLQKLRRVSKTGISIIPSYLAPREIAMPKWQRLYPISSGNIPDISSGEGDICPFIPGKAPVPAMGLLKYAPAILLVQTWEATLWAFQLDAGHRIYQRSPLPGPPLLRPVLPPVPPIGFGPFCFPSLTLLPLIVKYLRLCSVFLIWDAL